jgi:hypothetical protein
VYNGTFVIGIRPPGAQAEIIFGADSILEQPARRAEPVLLRMDEHAIRLDPGRAKSAIRVAPPSEAT